MTEERRLPNFLHNEEQYMRIKTEKKLIEYQVKLFRNELNKMQKRYDELKAGEERRAESYGAKYKTRKELDDAYMLGNMTDREYMQYRSAMWQAYSDRGYEARIKWLTAMLDHYQAKLDKITNWMVAAQKASREGINKRYRKRQKHYAYKRRVRRRERSEKKKQQYKELKERYKYYGLR